MGPGLFRFLLAATVVVHHSFPIRMGAWAVYVFFILSGYWIANLWEKKYRLSRWPVATFLVSRWWRLVPVLILCNALALISPYTRPSVKMVSFEWIARQILIVGSVPSHSILPPAWSLDVEAQFYLIAPFVLWVVKEWGVSVLLSVASFSCVCFLYFACWPAFPGHWQFRLGVVPYLAFFLGGVAIYLRSWKSSGAFAIGSIAIFLAITLLLALLPQTRGGIWSPGVDSSCPWWHQLWAGAGALLVLPFVASNVRSKSDRWDRLLGNWAYPLYLFHWLPRDWYYHQVNWSRPWWEQGILLGVNFLAALVGSFLILILLDRPFDQFRSRWVESRVKAGLRSEEDVITPAAS